MEIENWAILEEVVLDSTRIKTTRQTTATTQGEGKVRSGKAKGGERNEMGNKMRNEMRIVFPPNDACKTIQNAEEGCNKANSRITIKVDKGRWNLDI